MTKKTDGTVLLNDETVFMPQHQRERLPVRIDEDTAIRITKILQQEKPEISSCICTATAEWTDGKLSINTTYNPCTKCKPNLYTKSRPIRTAICIEKICTGKCVDIFMREMVTKRILPELYKQK
ncbi:MAG: hypothetical protein J5679_00295 [Alphaproteobacteria bacterium]|nr:hypothetical protein [Alphaproteobacteria bacterium]